MKKIILVISFIIVCYFIPKTVFSQDDRWVYLGASDDFSLYIDKLSIEYNSYNEITVWIKFDYYSDPYWNYSLFKAKFRKSSSSYYSYLQINYYKNGKITSQDFNKYEYIVPSTVMELVYDYLYK